MPDENTTTPSSEEEEEVSAEEIRQKQKEEQQKEDEENEEEFHVHKGKIMGMKQYVQISALNWDKSYDNPTANCSMTLHYNDDERKELTKYVYKGVSCKAKIRRSNEEQFTTTGLEEYDLSEDDIREREHYPTKEQLEELGIAEDLEELTSEDDGLTAEQKEQKKAEENKPYTRQDGDAGVYGFITDVTHDSKGTELEIKDWGYCLEDNTKKLAFNNMPRSQILEEVIKSYGLVPVVDFTGLKDDMISWTNVTSGGSSSNDDGTGNVTGDGSMTEEQAWQIASTFVYNHGTSTHEPQEAWDTLGDKPGGGVDCYSCTAWLYYVYNFKIGIPARDICYHSDYANSGSHHTIQYFKNGQWIDPPEYSNLTTNLKVISSRNKSEDHVCRSPPSGGSTPPYSRCPHSSNG